MSKYEVVKSGASKQYKDGKHTYYEVGETIEKDTIPASLLGKVKLVVEEKTTKTTTKKTA